jgi:multicomponent K+:H+ antiporter subunit G
MKSFYDRVHPPTLGSTMGMALIVLGSIVCFSVLRSRLSVHELVIGIFVTLTTPVTFMLLARAALYRDRAERRLDMPPADSDIVSDGEQAD